MRPLLSLVSLVFALNFAKANSYGASALDVVKNMELKKINEAREKQIAEEAKQQQDYAREFRMNPDNKKEERVYGSGTNNK